MWGFLEAPEVVCMLAVWGMQVNQTHDIPAWSHTLEHIILRLMSMRNVNLHLQCAYVSWTKQTEVIRRYAGRKCFDFSCREQNHLLRGQMRLFSFRCYQNWCWCFTNEVSQCLYGCSGSGSEEMKWVVNPPFGPQINVVVCHNPLDQLDVYACHL